MVAVMAMLLGVALAILLTACSSGPTSPSDADAGVVDDAGGLDVHVPPCARINYGADVAQPCFF